ncbi:MAG: hypothetical protein R2772_08120 [Chitinophagales bacterium]
MKSYLALFFLISLVACQQESSQNANNDLSLCTTLETDTAAIELIGTLVLNTKQELLFKSTSNDSLGIACPIYLIECGEGLNSYASSSYNAYASIRGLQDNFWIQVWGKFSNFEAYQNQEEDFEKLEFVYYHIALIDNPNSEGLAK